MTLDFSLPLHILSIMTYKLKIDRNVVPEKNHLQNWSESPIGYWHVTTDGECEGRTVTDLGTHYGHIVEIALSLKCVGYSLHFAKGKEPSGVYGSPEDQHHTRRIVHTKVNISLPCWTHKDGERELYEWLDCDEITVRSCNYYGVYTIVLKD